MAVAKFLISKLLFILELTQVYALVTFYGCVKDVRGKDGMKIKMEKTDTTVEVYFNSVLQQEIAKYTSNRADSDWIFPSRQG